MTDTLVESSAESAFLDLHKKLLEQGSPALEQFQQAALNRFESLGFPHSKHEMYTFVNTKGLAETSFNLSKGSVSEDFVASHIYPTCKDQYIVFVDGVFNPGLSRVESISASLISLSEAVTDQTLKDYISQTIEDENDVFASLSAAFCSEGLVFKVADNTQISEPVQVLFVSTGKKPGPVMHTPRLVWQLGKLAEVKVIEKFVGTEGGYFINSVQDWLLAEGAGVSFTQVQADPFDSWHFSKTRIRLDRNARFNSSNSSSGTQLARHHYDVRLEGEGSELRLNGVSVLDGKEQLHNFIRIHHEVPQCVSHQHFKNIVNGQGRSSFDGTVIVNQGAQLTSSNQLINNLMLSDECHANNKPNLMIFADDVKCTHGATIGQIDEEQWFYLQTRGLSAKAAKELLTRSFAKSIIQTIEFPEVVTELNDTLLKKLEVRNV
ncbi:MAG: Fe-S cluster assembly protein SufD [Nitrospina sp.]|jgi:Fe-S cluster assembly protein SufD|nr:Fe-S cluster assembly protein SufD [Nitrospina sp.]MBT3511198.1 Fe-S cluster assembly protein SufD [Nitrospina sp.]MBT3876093.1 Fe-S cluster assembly protein SufD [Nitrospina sp.]MBT4048401.1 Fe-S cluster assembly protein SufD [Nitrospina sp.]MBT4556529.1 Fe-S cluster assembly protein SufD [Nitrospina sp.]